MASLRLCTHIKTNGVKCGSPALRHHTMCYFHYQWQRRDQRRIRLGGPIGMGKNTGIELPLLDGPEAILVSIMEIQHALIDNRIEIKMGTALLYSLQLALQAKIPLFGLSSREAVRECPELDMDLEMERAKAMRPAKEKCSRCPKQDTCLSPRNCRKLPKLPAGYRREGDHLVRDNPDSPQQNASSFRAEHASACAVEGPASLPPEATTLENQPTIETSTPLLRESSPAGNCGDQAPPKFPPSRANARRQIDPTEPTQTLPASPHSAHDDTSKTDTNSYANCILGFKPNAHTDLPGKFPQLLEST